MKMRTLMACMLAMVLGIGCLGLWGPQGAYAAAESPTATGEPATWWWLRSPGTTQDSASSVTDVGVLTQNIATNRDAVRPALWVDLAGIR